MKIAQNSVEVSSVLSRKMYVSLSSISVEVEWAGRARAC